MREMYLINRLKSIRTEENARVIDDVIDYIRWQQLSPSRDPYDDSQEYLDNESDSIFFEEKTDYSIPEKTQGTRGNRGSSYWTGPGDNRRDGYSEFDIDE